MKFGIRINPVGFDNLDNDNDNDASVCSPCFCQTLMDSAAMETDCPSPRFAVVAMMRNEADILERIGRPVPTVAASRSYLAHFPVRNPDQCLFRLGRRTFGRR